MTEEEMARKAAELDLRLKELEIESKEYEKAHRPGVVKSAFTNPVVMAAFIAGLASAAAAWVTWHANALTDASQQIAATLQSQNQKAVTEAQREEAERQLEAGLIIQAVKTGEEKSAITNLKFLASIGLIKGDIGDKLANFLATHPPSEIKILPSVPAPPTAPSAQH